MIEVEAQRGGLMILSPTVPRLNRDIWKRLLDAHGGDAGKAKTTLDRMVKREADRLFAAAK